MRSFLLLVLSLMTGGEASAQVEGCADGWVDFTCPYPKNKDGQYESLSVVNPTKKSLKITKKDEDEIRDRVHVARDTDNKKVRVIIKQLRQEDIDEWKCEFGSSTNQHKGLQELETDEDECQKPFHQAAYKTAKTTIACEYPENSYESNVKFFCKESGSICKDILATQSSPLKNRMFTLTESYRGFNVSISKVSSQHKGVYWCGVKSKDGSYQAGLRQIRLTVEDIQADFKRSPTVGHNLTYWCKYQEESHIFICKGEDPSICPPLLNNSEQTSNERFSMEEDKTKKNITITVRHVTMQDNGTYWCGARSTDNTRSNTFFHRLSLIVVPLSTTAVSTTQSTPVASGGSGKRAGK
uniref:polymeric immunoglobulin receptor-like n=1 Tax=Semicossyphus pulcher TaxID=241346 RepID=UPI0037E8722E